MARADRDIGVATTEAPLCRDDALGASSGSERTTNAIASQLALLKQQHGQQAVDAAFRLSRVIFADWAHETSHEMLTVVTALKRSATCLQVSVTREQEPLRAVVTHVETIVERVDFLECMIRDARKLAQDRPSGVDRIVVSDLVQQAIRLVADGCRHDVTPVSLDVPPTLAIAAPYHCVLQALSSLIKNAFEAIDGVDGNLSIRGSRADNGCIELALRDSGRGMDDEEQALALVPGRTSKKDGEHTGFGLPLARKLIEHDCRGAFHLSSVAGIGTTVTLRFNGQSEDSGEASR